MSGRGPLYALASVASGASNATRSSTTSMNGLLDTADCDDPHTALPLLLHGSAISRPFLDSHTGDFVLHPPAPSHAAASTPPPMPLSTALSAPFSSPHCSFAVTYYRHAPQLWRPCYTCNLIDANGCCSVCAAVCHAGHQLGEERISNFFCDCGSRGPALCLCLPESPYHSQHGHAAGTLQTGDAAPAVALAAAAELSGGLAAGNPNVDLSAVASGVLATNKLTFRCDDRPTLPERVRHTATQLLARDQRRRVRQREQRHNIDADPAAAAAQVRRASSFTLGALASCLEETEEEQEEDETAYSAAADELSPVLLAIGHYVSKQQSFSLRLAATERPLYDKVIRHYRRMSAHRLAASGSSSHSLSTIIDSSLRLWLTVGGVEERLNAAAMLLECHVAGVTSLPPSITPFLESFSQRTARYQHRILRTSRSSHYTELSTAASTVNFDLFCSALALVSPIPCSTNLSPSSATAFSSITSASPAQQHGIYPSLALSTDASCLYFLSSRYGLVRLGTGEGDSVAGELLAQNVELALHAGGHLVCVRPRADQEDVLLLRSPLLPRDTLLRFDPRSLQLLGDVTLERGMAVSSANEHYPFDVDYEIVSRTPSTSTTPHWQLLAPVLRSSSDFSSLSPDSYSLIQQCLASNSWKLNDRFALSASVYLTVAAGGVFLIMEQAGQLPTHYRLRIRTSDRPTPLIPDQRYVHSGQSAPFRIASFMPVRGGVGMEVFEISSDEREASLGDERKTAAEATGGAVQQSVWDRVDRLVVYDYHHPLPVVQSNVPSTAASQPVSNSANSSVSSPLSSVVPSSTLRSCDGCGLIDWRDEDEYVCVDGCSDVRLCMWCQLHDRFNTATHSTQHHMDHRLASIPPHPPFERRPFLQSELWGGVLLADGDRLLLLPPPLPLTSLRHWRDFAVGDVVDVRDMYQKWYQADILAVNAADKSVLVHYQGWHTKWDEWISTNTDRFAPRASLSAQNKAASAESTGHKQDGSEGGRRAVRQAVRVMRLVAQGGDDDDAEGERYEHCTDVVVRTRGQAFACFARTGQVWCIDEDGVIEQWNNDSKPTDTPQLTVNHDHTVPTLAAACSLLAACPVLSVSAESVQRQLSLIFSLLDQLLDPRDWVASSVDVSALVVALLDYLTRLVHRSQLVRPSVAAEGPALLDEIRALLQASLSASPAPPESVQTSILNVLVAGLPLFFPAWEQRLAFASDLHTSLSSEPTSLHSPRRRALAALGSAAYSTFSGSSGVTLTSAADESLFDPSTMEQAQHLINRLVWADETWMSDRLRDRHGAHSSAVIPRRHVYLLVSFLSQLYTSLQPPYVAPGAARSYSALSPADKRNLSGLLPFLTLSTSVLEQVNTVLLVTRQQLRRMEFETDSQPSAGAVMEALRSCALFHVLTPLLSWLPEVLQLVASGVYEHYMHLDTVLEQLVTLMVDLAHLVLPPDSSKQLALSQLLASLRETRQLTTLQNKQGVQHRTLTPFARQVFTGLFRHFSAAHSDGGDKELVMSCDDFIRLYSHCHLPPTVPAQSAASSVSPPGAPPLSGGPTGIPTSSPNAVVVPIHSQALPAPTAPPSTASTTVRSSGSGAASTPALPSRQSSIPSNVRVIAISDGLIAAGSSASSSSLSTSAVPITVSFRDQLSSHQPSPSPAAPSSVAVTDNSVAVTIIRPATQPAALVPSSAPVAISQPSASTSHAATAPLPLPPPASSSATESQRQPMFRPSFPLVLLPSIGLLSSPSPPAALSNIPSASIGASPSPLPSLPRSPSSTSVSISAASAARARLLFYKLVLHAGKQSSSEPSDSASVGSLTQRQCIDLRTFLRFQLEQCKADPSAVMEQLRAVQTTVEWNKVTHADSPSATFTATANDLPPVKLTAESVLDDLRRVYSCTLVHLYPALSIVHNAPNPHLPADQLPSIVSMSTLPGISPPPATAITAPQLDYESVMERLMESQAHWSQHATYSQHKDFLQRFVLVDAEKLQQDRMERARDEERRQARKSDWRHRANSERGSRQSSRAVHVGREDAFASTAPIAQVDGDADDPSEEDNHQPGKQVHETAAGELHEEDVELKQRQLEQQVKAQHDNSEWQSHASSKPSDEQKQPLSSPVPSPSPAPSSVPPATATPLAYDISEPALCLSALLHRCLGEMGGGYAKRRVEVWREALAAERAYAAACIKHHGYTERAMRYSSSIAIVELLRRALQPHSRTRCLSHPSLPQWFKSVVQATFRDVRSPLLSVLRELDEEMPDESKEAETSADDVQSVLPTANGDIPASTSATAPPPTSTAASAEELSAAHAAAAHLVRHAQSNLAALRIEYTSLTAQPQQRSPQIEAAAASQSDNMDMDSRMAAMLANVSRTRQDLEDANNNLRRNIALMDEVVKSMRQKAESVDDKRTAKLRAERERANRRMQVNMEASALVSDLYKNAWFIVNGIDSVQLNVSTDMPGQHAHSFASDAAETTLSHMDRLTAIRISSGSRRRHSLLSIQPSQHSDLKQLAADVLQQSQSDLTQRNEDDEDGEGGEQQTASRNMNDSLDPAMMRSYSTRPRHHAHQQSISNTGAAASSLWSTWSVSSAASNLFDSQPFDSSWINQLVRSKSTIQLADSLQPAIQRYHTVSRLRLRLVQLINSEFRAGKRAELLAYAIPSLLPCLSRSKHGSHLLYNSGLLLREDESQRTLLSFYKHIVDALNNPTGGDLSSTTTVPLTFSSSSWPVMRQCLHLLNVDFLPEDTEAVVGSGVFASLSRWMTQIDKVLDKHRLHQLGSTAASSATSTTASRALTRSHTRSSSLTSSGTGAVTSCPAAYALKRLMWQTYMHLALVYLSQQQQHTQRQQQIDNQTQLLDASAASLVTDSFKGDNVVTSSLSAMYASALLSDLARLSRAPARVHFHSEDGLLRETQDAAVMMLHLARLKPPALSPAQLARLVQLMPFAPPATQQTVVQLMGHELGKVTPKEFDQYFHQTQTLTSTTLTAASPTIVNSAAAFTASLLGHLGDLLDRSSTLSALMSVSPLLTARSHRSGPRDQKEAADSKQAQWNSAIGLDDETWRQGVRGWNGQSGKRGRPGDLSSDYPTFASPDNVLFASASHSTYQQWRSGEEQQFNTAQTAVLEELILVVRSLCLDGAWRRLLLQQLIQPVLALPSTVRTLRTRQTDSGSSLSLPPSSTFASASPLCQAVSAGCASLAVLGGWAFTLRRGAYVQVNMQGDFAAERAAPATAPLLPAAGATVHRGFVQSVDFDARSAAVLTSPSQPRFPARLYRVDDLSLVAGPAELSCATFSFDQLRSIPAISAPNLNDHSTFAMVWSALAAVLDVPLLATPVQLSNNSLSSATTSVMQLTQAFVQRLAVGVVHSQATMAVRLQASTKLHVDTRSTQRPNLEDSLVGPISPSFGELLASPLIQPLTLSPPPSATDEGSDSTPTSLPSFSLASSTDTQTSITWTLQPVQTSSLSSNSLPPQPSRHSSISSHRSPVGSPEPRPARQAVDYSVFVGHVMQLSKCASHNFLFSLTPFGVDAALRQLSHGLSFRLTLDVQRRRRLSSLATRLSRVASRATSRALTRSASLHVSGSVTPASHEEGKQQAEQPVDTMPPLATLPMFPQLVSGALTAAASSRRPHLITDDNVMGAPSVQSTPRESALADWSAVTSQSPSPSSLPHFIHDPSDPLHTPIWSPTPRLDLIIHRLQAQLPPIHTAEAARQQHENAEEDDEQSTEDEHSEPTSPADNDDTREMQVHDEDDEPVDHTDTMFVPHDRQHPNTNNHHTDNEDYTSRSRPPTAERQHNAAYEDYTDDLFDDDQLDAILDPPQLTRFPADPTSPMLSSSPFNHVVFHYLYGLVSIGYPDHCARFALARCGGNLHAALEFLLSGEITLFDEYTQVGAAMMAFQHLLYRLGLIERDDENQAPGTTSIESAPVVYRNVAVTQHSERELLLSAIEHLSAQQSRDMSSLALYDWVDARDSYGKRFLSQVVRRTADPPAVTVHFLAWQDQFNENIALPSERLQPVTAAVIEQTRQRLEGDRQLSRVKVYGLPVHQWITAERAKLAALSEETYMPSSIHMADPYSFPVTHAPARVDPLSQAAAASSELLGARVYITPESVALLHASLCLPAVEVASEYVVGNKLLVVDTVGKLCEAEITEVRGTEIRIHYPGWGGKWDETLSVHSPRIQGRQGRNKRQVREGSVMPGSDSAKQLYELIGSTGIVVDITRGCKLEAGERGRGRAADKGDDALVQVEVLDQNCGTVITFRTRLALLKRVEAADTPQLSQSALLAMSRSQLLQTNLQAEQSALAAQAGQMLQTLTQLTLPRPATDVHTVKLHQLLDAFAITNRLSRPLFEAARNGWADSVYGQVGESCLVVPARHVQPWTQSAEQDAPAPPEGTELTLDSHPHALAFCSLDPLGREKEEWRVCDVCRQPRCGPMFACRECAHKQCMPCTVHALPFAHSPPPSQLSAPLEAKDDKRETEADKAAQWIDTTAYRPRGRSADREKLQLLDALMQQLLTAMPESGDLQLRWFSPETLTMLRGEVQAVARLMTSAMDSQGEQQHASEDQDEVETAGTNLRSLLSCPPLTELRAGQRVRLHVDRPGIDSLLVAWPRTSQANFDLYFYQCVPADLSSVPRLAAPLPALAPPANIATGGAGNQQEASQASEESIQLADESSRSSSEPAGAITVPPTPRVARTQFQVCEPVDSLPPALMCLRALPPLKAAGVPLLVPNPCYVSVGGVRRGKDEIADPSDDELHIVVTPVKRTSLDGIALWAELLMHVRREWMLTVAHTTAESLRPEVLQRLRDSHQQLCTLLMAVLDAVLRCLMALHGTGPWPSTFVARSAELAAHLLLSATEALNLPASHPLFVAIDIVLPKDEQLARWTLCLEAVRTEFQLRSLAEIPVGPLHSAYLHRLTEFVTASSLFTQLLTRHSEYQQAAQHHNAVPRPRLHPHELTRALLRAAPQFEAQHDHYPFSVVLGAPSLYEQSGHIADCPCQYCQAVASKSYRAEVMAVDFNSPFWALAMGCSPLALPPAHRYALLDAIINATANADKTQPEFILYTPKDKALESAALSSSSTSAHPVAEDSSVMRQLFLQLSNTSPSHFQHKLGEISFKALFKGPFHRGAQGTPGPFRQVLTDVCADLRRSSATSLLIPCPNFTHDTGLNRNQLMLNPAAGVRRSDAEALGRLMGIALRSGGVLDIDVAAIVWKQLVGQHVDDSELAQFDFTAHNTLRFKDYTSPDDDMSEEEWSDNYGQLTWTTLASDGVTRLQLRAPSTARPYVLYSERKLYAKAVIRARFSESMHLLDCVKAGLYAIVPRAALSVLRWTELRHRVCGDSEVDLDALAAHTVYAPKSFTFESPIVQWLWSTLRSFSADERGKFLQFCLARSRLPPTTSREGSWRMKVNVLEAANQRDLPTAETCFFNLNLPQYRSERVLREKLHLAIMHCSSING